MPGIKIINVLKDDTLAEILDIFRQAPVGEVIFVLPRTGKLFRKEDHFSAFASEAANGGKTISILTSSPATATLARKYKFNVMSSGKGKAEKAVAQLTVAPPPADDVRDDNDTAVDPDSRVVGTSDETVGTDSVEEDDEKMDGFHIEDVDGPVAAADEDDAPAQPAPKDPEDSDADLTAAPPAPVPQRTAVSADLDYIDAVWRSKATNGTATAAGAPARKARSSWNLKQYLRMPKFPAVGSLHSSKRMVAGALALSVVLLGAAIYMTVGSAAVSINPSERPVDLQLTVQASDVFSSVDANFNKIPGQLFEVSKTATVQQDATGQRDVASKSRVRLTVHNEFSSTPQPLVATTRFATADGMIFRTLQSVTVPGSTVREGNPVAGTIEVDAIADKPGPQYNVAAGKWTVVAFTERGETDRAAKIFGVSSAAASGGASGPSKVVTQADYDKARAEAVESLKAQINEAFSGQQGGLRILDEAEPELGEVTSSARPDDAAETVSVTAAGTLRTVAFRQTDLDQLIVDGVLARERLVVVPAQLELSFENVAFKSDTGVLEFAVTVKGTGYSPVDPDVIRSDIKGNSSQQIRDYFADREGVESATVSLRPFWVRRVPTKDSRIDIEVLYGPPAATPSEN